MGVHVLDAISKAETAGHQKVRDFLLHSKAIHVILVVLLIVDGLICLVCGVLETNYLHGQADDCMAHVDLCVPLVHHRRLDHDLHTPLEGLPWLTDYETDPETSPRQLAGRSLSSAASGSHSSASGSHSAASGSKSAASGSNSAASGSHAASTTVAYKGSMTVKASVTSTQMKTAMTKTLAHEFSVKESEVAVTVTEGHRRLDEISAAPRQLAGSWAIAFTITAPAAQAAAIQSKVTALSSNSASMKTQMATQLKAAGASDAAANSMTMASLSIAKADTSGSHSGGHAVSERYKDLDPKCGTHVHFGDHDLHNAEKMLTYVSIGILTIFFLEQVALIAELRMEYCKPMFLLDFFVICSALAIEIMLTRMAVGGLLVIARTWRFARVGHGMIEIQQNTAEVMECDNEVDCMMSEWAKLPDARWRAIRKADNCHMLEDQGDFSKEELEIVTQLGESPAVALRALAYAKAYKEHCDKNPKSAHHLVSARSIASNNNAKNAV